MATASPPSAGNFARGRRNFRRWRRSRPFWGGLVLMLSGTELFFSGNLNPTDLQVHFGSTGFLSYVIPVMLLLCGVLTWASPNQRLFYGIVGCLVAVYSLIGLNLGGFFIGMLLGMVGGALTVAWSPVRPVPPVPPAAPGNGGQLQPYSDGDGEYRTRMLAVTLVPTTLAAVLLFAVSHPSPAYAQPCQPPTGHAPAAGSPTPNASGSRSPTVRTPTPAISGTAAGKPVPATSATPSATSTGTGHPIADGWNNFVDGLKKFFGGNGTTTGPGEPVAASPSPGTGGGTPDPSTSRPPTVPTRRPSATPSASASGSTGPCAGARTGADPAQPLVAARPAILTGASLTMFAVTFDGVVDNLPTATGTVRALKFTMAEAVTTPFELKIPERNGKSTVITSTSLTIHGNVVFYTPRFSGKLLGIPLTFTPDSPPPLPDWLKAPKLGFTDVTIDLAFVRCDTLSTPPRKTAAEPPTLEIHAR